MPRKRGPRAPKADLIKKRRTKRESLNRNEPVPQFWRFPAPFEGFNILAVCLIEWRNSPVKKLVLTYMNIERRAVMALMIVPITVVAMWYLRDLNEQFVLSSFPKLFAFLHFGFSITAATALALGVMCGLYLRKLRHSSFFREELAVTLMDDRRMVRGLLAVMFVYATAAFLLLQFSVLFMYGFEKNWSLAAAMRQYIVLGSKTVSVMGWIGAGIVHLLYLVDSYFFFLLAVLVTVSVVNGEKPYGGFLGIPFFILLPHMMDRFLFWVCVKDAPAFWAVAPFQILPCLFWGFWCSLAFMVLSQDFTFKLTEPPVEKSFVPAGAPNPSPAPRQKRRKGKRR